MTPGGYAEDGEGWRLAWEAGRQPFPLLIGGAGWAVELSGPEAVALRAGVATLLEQLEAIADQLLPGESISLELERELCWLGLEGDRRTWALRFVLSPPPGQRAVEGGWDEAASAELAAALTRLPF